MTKAETWTLEIPWEEIWAEFDEWYDDEEGWPDWLDQKKKIVAILKDRIRPQDRRGFNPSRVWRSFSIWCDDKNRSYPGWYNQKRKIQQLFQQHLDRIVNN